MHNRSRTLLALVAGALSLSFGGCLVGPTNPWDGDAPPELQMRGVLEGMAAFPSVSGEAPRPPEGIKVSVRQPEGEVADEVITTAAGRGGFRFELPPGDWIVRAEHPSFAPATVGPLRIGAGATVSVDRLELRLPAATSSLSGRVVAQGGLSAQGVEVSLVHDAGALGCGAVEAKRTTDESGAFRFDPVRPGRYVVIARTEGATVDVLAGAEAVVIDDDEEAVLPRDLVIEPGTSVVAIEAEGVAPASTTRVPNIVVHTRALVAMSEIQLGGDPTFDPSLGGTGWRPFQTQTAFTLPPFEGEWTVFVQLRAGCVTSPLYAARLLYDPNPPEIVTGQVGSVVVDPLELERPLVVVGAGQAGVPTTFTVIDDSGVAAVRFSLTAGGATTTQTVTITPQPGQAVVRATAEIPIEEGRYTLQIELEDAAGNRTLEGLSPIVDVLRDVSVPTTPLPTAPVLEVAGGIALAWLEERDCPDGARAAVCEVNPHPDGLYRIRGGALVDFAPFAAPPFELPLAEDAEESVFEIVAVDAAGHRSPASGFVTVLREVPRVVFTAPRHNELGHPRRPNTLLLPGEFHDDPPSEPVAFYEEEPSLAVTNGTAFFSLRATDDRTTGPHFSYLIAQPAELSSVGLDWASSRLPTHIRRLNTAFDLFYWLDPYDRQAGALGAGAGALTWLERLGTSSPTRPMRFVHYSDADGRYDIRGPEPILFDPFLFDHTDVPAPALGRWRACEDSGPARCALDPWSWAPGNQVPPFATAFDGRRLLTSGAAQRKQRLTGADDGDVQITGPRVLATVLEPVPAAGARLPPLVSAVGLRIGVPAGEVIYGAFYELSESTYDDDLWELATFDFNPWLSVHVAEGGGEEVLLAPHNFLPYDAPIAVGVLIPEGVTVTVPRLSLPAHSGFPYRAVGLLERVVASPSLEDALLAEGDRYVDQPGRALDLTLFLAERDPGGLGSIGGLSLFDLGADGLPSHGVVPHRDYLADESLAEGIASERHGQLATSTTPDLALYTADDRAVLEVPEAGCALVVKPKVDVQLRGLTLEGNGELDELWARVWERTASPLGRYTPARVNPTLAVATGENLSSPDGAPCATSSAVLDEGSFNGDADVTVVDSDTRVEDVEYWPVYETIHHAGTYEGSALLPVLLAPPNAGRVVPEGRRVLIRHEPSVGDSDLFVRWGAPPTEEEWDCRPYYSGTTAEECDLEAPPGGGTLYAAILTWGGSYEWDITIEELEPTLRVVATYPLTAGDVARVTLTPTLGDPELFLAVGRAPTLDDYDCRSITVGVDECQVLAEGSGDLYVAVYEWEVPVAYELETDIVRPEVAVLDTLQVAPGQRLSVDVSSPYAVVPVARLDDAGEWLAFSCTGPVSDQSCTLVVSGSATSATVGISALEQPTPFTADVRVEQLGCSKVYAGAPESFGAGSFAGVLRAGRHYLITMGDAFHYASQVDWPEEQPAIRVGPPQSSAYLDVLGAAEIVPEHRYDTGDSQIVTSLSAQAPVCRFGLDVTPSVRFARPALGETQAAAVRVVQRSDGRVDSAVITAELGRVERRSPLEPAVVKAHDPGWRVAALAYHGDRLYWLAHDEGGRRATLWRANAGLFPPTAACEVKRFPAGVTVSAADIDEGRLIVATQSAGGQALEVHRFTDGGTCGGAEVLLRVPLEAMPLALAVERGDAFLWLPPRADDGGRLAYVSLRELVPVWSSVHERVLGFDARSGDLAFTLVDDEGGVRVMRLESDASSGSPAEARSLPVEGARTHLRFVGRALASVAPSAPDGEGARRPEVRLKPLDEGAGPEITLPSASHYFAGMEPYDEDDVERWGAETLLEADGDTLAVLGKDPDGVRRLAIFVLPPDPAAWPSLTPEHEERLTLAGEEPTVERLVVENGAVVVTFEGSAPPTVLSRLPSSSPPSWQLHGVGALDVERVLGLWQGRLLLMRAPTDLFDLRPSPHVELFLRDLDTGAPLPGDPVTALGRMPAESYLRRFSFVGPGVDGALSLYDASEPSAVLWRLEDSGFFTRDDGGHRPLTAGGVGRAAGPRSSGEALYFLRRQGSRVSLVRYRELP